MAKVPAVYVEKFAFRKKELNVVLIDGDPWFSLSELCKWLDIKNPSQAKADHLDDDEVRVLGPSDPILLTLRSAEGQNLAKVRQLNLVSESGFYSLVIRSKKATDKGHVAYKFKKWVTKEVLPALRKTGKYETAQKPIQEAVGPAYHDFTPPRTAPGEVEVYSPPATLADLVAFGMDLKKEIMADLAKNMPEILKHAMESGGKRSFMSQWRDKTRAYIAETVAEDVSQVDDQLDDMTETIEQVRDRLVDLEAAHKKLAKKINADKGLSNKVKRQMQERLETIEEDIASLKRVVAPVKKKKTVKSKKRTLN